MLVEICTDSLKSTIAAVSGGANRIELCSALELGGLTPTIGLLKAAKKQCANVPIYCMIRCRAGDFFYNDLEMKTMLSDVELLKQYGADGFVFGALTLDYNIEMAQCCAIVSAASPLPVTFHRAFDYCGKNWRTAVDNIVEAGFKCILTSGQKETAIDGIQMLSALKKYTKERPIDIMAGSGITAKTLPKLLAEVGTLDAVHSSASVLRKVAATESAFSLGICDNNGQKETLPSLVAELVHIAANSSV